MQGVLFVVLVNIYGVKQEANHVIATVTYSDCESNHVFQGYMSAIYMVGGFAIIALHWEKHIHCMDNELQMSQI